MKGAGHETNICMSGQKNLNGHGRCGRCGSYGPDGISMSSLHIEFTDSKDICNTLQILKYFKTGNFVKFLSVKLDSPANYLSNKTKIIQLYMPEPDVQKMTIYQSFFLSFL